jgi:hypothetical protein
MVEIVRLPVGIGTIRDEAAMLRFRKPSTPENRVNARFGTSAASFDLPCTALLEELADRLDFLSDWYGYPLTGVDVRVCPLASRNPNEETACDKSERTKTFDV